jgi:uncharacterized delta-60 repeat protein
MQNRLARLNADGSLDMSFAATDVDNSVAAIVVQTDGRIVIGGTFGQVGASPRNYIARLNADGTVDTAFDPNANLPVKALAQQPDGKLLVGCVFTEIGGQTRNRVARLNADGTLDAAFDPDANGSVGTLTLQPDGKLVVGGEFTTIGGQVRSYLARLNADGSLDAAFNPNPSHYILALPLQTDGKLVAGDGFTTIAGQSRNNIARLSMPQVAQQSLSIGGYAADPSAVTWARSGAGPELALPPQLLFSPDGKTYIPVAAMQRVTAAGAIPITFRHETRLSTCARVDRSARVMRTVRVD